MVSADGEDGLNGLDGLDGLDGQNALLWISKEKTRPDGARFFSFDRLMIATAAEYDNNGKYDDPGAVIVKDVA